MFRDIWSQDMNGIKTGSGISQLPSNKINILLPPLLQVFVICLGIDSKNGFYIKFCESDGTACVCDVTKMDGNCSPLLTYVGHNGCSVNCVKFHPNSDLIMSAAGDGTTHIWRPNLDHVFNQISSFVL